MEQMLLSELCKRTEVTRRMIQGYEKAGLLKADQRNKYGYLLYDETAVERVKKIRFFQEMGFGLKDISEIIDKPVDSCKDQIIAKIEDLENKKRKLECVINEAWNLLESRN